MDYLWIALQLLGLVAALAVFFAIVKPWSIKL